MRVLKSRLYIAAASIVMLSCLGCASSLSDQPRSKKANLFQRMPWAGKTKAEEEMPYPSPVKLAATWSPDTLVQTGRTPTRGFGGRIFFYDEKSRPVPVDGTLVVHGFDEGAADPQKGVKRFEFTPEQFTKHFSKTDMGASYSVWIPWDAVGGERKRVSLVASFKTKEGRPVQGAPTMIMLPGTKPTSESNSLARKLAPEYKKYKTALANNVPRHSGLITTTIERRRLKPQMINQTPSITLPASSGRTSDGASDSMLAAGTNTPSVEIDMFKRSDLPQSGFQRPGSPAIMPTSGQLPVQSSGVNQPKSGPSRSAIQALLKR